MSIALKPTCDRKTKFHATQRNTFGLLPGKEGTCPGCTTAKGGCWYQIPGRRLRTCYVCNIMNIYKNVAAVLQHNTDLLKRDSNTIEDMQNLLDIEFRRFEASEASHAKRTGEPEQLFYRLHWSGDVFSDAYATALVKAMQLHPRITFWGYTRSFESVPILAKAENLLLYLSLDAVNFDNGMLCYVANNGGASTRLNLCYMSEVDDFEARRKQAVENLGKINNIRRAAGLAPWDLSQLEGLKITTCPVDVGVLPTEGGCKACGACTSRVKRVVWFKS